MNGGADNPLSLGPDERRLLNDGDFNVDIDRTLLQEGANEVVITALDSLNSITQSTVTVNYTVAVTSGQYPIELTGHCYPPHLMGCKLLTASGN